MKIKQLTIREGLKSPQIFQFSTKSNLIFSSKNAVGKTTLIRSILYTLGYPIPSTKKLPFEQLSFSLSLEVNGKEIVIHRNHLVIDVSVSGNQSTYYLYDDALKLQEIITGLTDKNVNSNLLGAFYFDQEKGWTLLNRGKVIGKIPFNVEALIRGLSGKDISKLEFKLETVKKQINKLEQQFNFAQYQKHLYTVSDEISDISHTEKSELNLAILKNKRKELKKELSELKNIYRENKLLIEFIENLNLEVKTKSGESIFVNSKTLSEYQPNNEIINYRINVLSTQVNSISQEIKKLEKDLFKENDSDIQKFIDKMDQKIRVVELNFPEIKNALDQLKIIKANIESDISEVTKNEKPIIEEISSFASLYASKFGVNIKEYIKEEKFLFTHNLKSLSGSILTRIIIAYKLAYIQGIREYTNLVLPIIIDSPQSDSELKNIKEILKFIKTEFEDHQLIIASTDTYNIGWDNTIMIDKQLLDDNF